MKREKKKIIMEMHVPSAEPVRYRSRIRHVGGGVSELRESVTRGTLFICNDKWSPLLVSWKAPNFLWFSPSPCSVLFGGKPVDSEMQSLE